MKSPAAAGRAGGARDEVQAAQAAKQLVDDRDYPKPKPATPSSTYFLNEVGWLPLSRGIASTRVTGMPPNDAMGHIDYVLWAPTGYPLQSSKRSALPRVRRSASSRPSFTPTAWRSSSVA